MFQLKWTYSLSGSSSIISFTNVSCIFSDICLLTYSLFIIYLSLILFILLSIYLLIYLYYFSYFLIYFYIHLSVYLAIYSFIFCICIALFTYCLFTFVITDLTRLINIIRIFINSIIYSHIHSPIPLPFSSFLKIIIRCWFLFSLFVPLSPLSNSVLEQTFPIKCSETFTGRKELNHEWLVTRDLLCVFTVFIWKSE